ncbi:class A beta-lactamase [Streptomyces gilvosporeus]|uniref:Beta-lactamase n=1 Tax=Streptomyces gilvosporeus TaxID=553510 RepID=A0A1V0TKQ5_9ACTN|nr:class A beta-lactamase [Streptomyces gilvosporeus]ARF53509.1 class A beta-lactamase [Streptomyces gilvosporeus]
MTSATPTPLPRRGVFKAGLALSTAAILPAVVPPHASAAPGPRGTEATLRDLERQYGARLGVFARNVRNGRVVAHRAGERFAMCSTFKTFAAAAVLREHGRCAPLDKVIHYPARDILPNSPITEQHVDTGMTVGALCAAAIRYSDNAAGNLLLRQTGGPGGLTDFFRSIGDPVSRLDRWETDLNAAVPGDPRDTTTPQAIGRSLERVTLGRALDEAGRRHLVTWLKGNTTSGERFRAGLPGDWIVADKTGTGDYASANDIGVAWTTEKTPIVLVVLSSKPARDATVDNALIADAARVLARALAPGE